MSCKGNGGLAGAGIFYFIFTVCLRNGFVCLFYCVLLFLFLLRVVCGFLLRCLCCLHVLILVGLGWTGGGDAALRSHYIACL